MRDGADLPAERTAAIQGAYRPSFERFFDHTVPWVGCQYLTPALAQEAGMGTAEFADSSTAPACSTGTRSASGRSATRTASTPPTR